MLLLFIRKSEHNENLIDEKKIVNPQMSSIVWVHWLIELDIIVKNGFCSKSISNGIGSLFLRIL